MKLGNDKEKEEEKYSKLKEALSYDNTKDNILREYLKIEKIYNKKEYDENINIYYYHISPEAYKIITGEKKNPSSIELIKKLFILFNNYDLKGKSDDDQFEKKDEINKYLYNEKDYYPVRNANSTYNMYINFELTIYEIYKSLYYELKEKIKSILEIILDEKQNLEEKLDIICLTKDHKKIKLLLKDDKVDKNSILLYNSIFFESILKEINDYIKKVNKTIEKCLKFENPEKDFYILFFIILEIKYIISNDAQPFYTDRIAEYSNIPDDNYLKDLSNKKLYDKLPLMIKEINKYNVKEIINEINKGEDINNFNQIRLYKYIRLEYYNSDNIIRHMMKFIEQFNEKISNSKTIVSALYEFYPELKDYKLFESKFTGNLFKDAIKNCYFFPFPGKTGSITLRDSGTILFFIPNKTKINEYNTEVKLLKNYYLIGNLAVFLYNELHEVLGHYLRIILSKIIDYNYISPLYPYSDYNEAGQGIEFLLFGKRISLFSIKQLLYLLDVKNYDKELKVFNEDFNNVDSIPFTASEDLKNMLKEIDIVFSEKLLEMDNNTTLFRDNYILKEDAVIELPILKNCVEDYDFCQDETLDNLIKTIILSNK